MRFPYADAHQATARAFSSPRPAYKNIWSTGVRSYGDMTAMERIALDGMVQSIAIHHCPTASVMAFRAQWEDDIEMAADAMRWHVDAFVRPGRWIPAAFGLEVLRRWTRRKFPGARPIMSDSQWAKAMNLDRRTVTGRRIALVEQVKVAESIGLDIMAHRLRTAGLIPDDA